MSVGKISDLSKSSLCFFKSIGNCRKSLFFTIYSTDLAIHTWGIMCLPDIVFLHAHTRSDPFKIIKYKHRSCRHRSISVRFFQHFIQSISYHRNIFQCLNTKCIKRIVFSFDRIINLFYQFFSGTDTEAGNSVYFPIGIFIILLKKMVYFICFPGPPFSCDQITPGGCPFPQISEQTLFHATFLSHILGFLLR